jgi:hypothetical protein
MQAPRSVVLVDEGNDERIMETPDAVVNDTKVNWSFVEGSTRGGLCGGEGGGGGQRRRR